ncbi:AAA family ATPase [Paenibacillus sp. OT2-17]|uniref:ATP-binding protein n=1 Tax=Paenibacillus sp. OT2-17 TaxID=2691605 RepID=UPI00135573C6|nr:ATP-binding protein [Paenibacillus sp. OT2-17]MXO78609.1 AAA family ATPase [Paenibacillus sp. OT2-17]
MDRVVNRIKLMKLYSQPEVFEPILFEDGVNIILGEKSDATTTSGRKTNGVGKSMSIEFINFCLFKKYSDSRIRLIPHDALSDDVYINLDLKIGQEYITILRSKKEQDRPLLKKNGETIVFENVDEAQRFFNCVLGVFTYD